MSDTHFGYEQVDESAKARRVQGVFDSVAPKYDLMNDLMSLGLHRAGKAYAVAVANLRAGDRVLDIAGGTGDLARAFAQRVGASGMVVHSDINEAMLRQGRDRLLDEAIVLPTVLCDAEKLPFPDCSFDAITIAFGIRNVPRIDVALAEAHRVLKVGGRFLFLEFSSVDVPGLDRPYDPSSFHVTPAFGRPVPGPPGPFPHPARSRSVRWRGRYVVPGPAGFREVSFRTSCPQDRTFVIQESIVRTTSYSPSRLGS